MADKKNIAWGKGQFVEDPIVRYTLDHSLRLTPVQEKLIKDTKEKYERYFMMGSADVLQLLANMVKLINGKKTLDVGVFTGYSALAIASVLPPDGKVFALETNEEYGETAKIYWKEAGVEDKIDLRINPAKDTLEQLVAEGESGTFDFAFIDADKPNYTNYYELCLQLLRPGGFLAIDNVIWGGRVLDPADQTESTKSIRALNERVRDDTRVDISMLKIGDGVTLAFKK